MSKTKLLIAYVGPESQHGRPRTVYVCLDPQITAHTDEIQDEIHFILSHQLRPSDHLVYPADSADIVVRFAERHGLLADPIDNGQSGHDPVTFDLVVGIEPPPTPDRPVASLATLRPLTFALKHRLDIYVTQIASFD